MIIYKTILSEITPKVANRLQGTKKPCNEKRDRAYYIWCRNQESNSGPTDYKSVALPTELLRQEAVHSSKAGSFTQEETHFFW